MFDRLNNLIFSIVILHILKSTNVYAIRDCHRDDIPCYKDGRTWCCNSVANICGRSVGSCRAQSEDISTPSTSTFRALGYTPTTSTVSYLTSSDVTTSVDPVVIIIPVMVVFVCLIICCVACVCYQRRQEQFSPSSIITTLRRKIVQPREQQFIREPTAVFDVQSEYNTDTTIPFPPNPDTYEVPPPSYSVATANFVPMHQPESQSLPPRYSMISD
ncbi:hypothetical protein I4U23_022734 [Adineta vaga]|nr:hypothetical protein I4U23_022734 [Adineta vaga]